MKGKRKMKKNAFIITIFIFSFLFINLYINDIQAFDDDFSRYYYNTLNLKEKIVYKKIDNAVSKRRKNISLTFLNISDDELKKVFTFYFFENPKHFDLSKVYTVEEKNNGFVRSMYINYYLTKDEKELMAKEINKELNIIIEKTKGMSDIQKSSYVYKYLVEKNSYYKKGPFFNTIYGSLVLGKANCEGMSSSYMYIMNKLNVPTIQALGTIVKDEKRENHSWNVSLINNNHYYTDTTFAIGKNLTDDNFYKYLNMSEKESMTERKYMYKILQKEVKNEK